MHLHGHPWRIHAQGPGCRAPTHYLTCPFPIAPDHPPEDDDRHPAPRQPNLHAGGCCQPEARPHSETPAPVRSATKRYAAPRHPRLCGNAALLHRGAAAASVPTARSGSAPCEGMPVKPPYPRHAAPPAWHPHQPAHWKMHCTWTHPTLAERPGQPAWRARRRHTPVMTASSDLLRTQPLPGSASPLSRKVQHFQIESS